MTELDRFARSHRCSDCQQDSRLAVRWNGRAEEVWCPVCKSIGPFAPAEKSLHQQWQENPESVPVHIQNRFADLHANEINEVLEGLPPELRPAFEKGRK